MAAAIVERAEREANAITATLIPFSRGEFAGELLASSLQARVQSP